MAFARAINTMGLSLVMSFLGIYIVESRGYPAWVYGVIALAANLGQSLSSAWAGDLSDRIGRRPLITNALFVRSFFIALLGTQILVDAPLWSLALNMVITSSLRGCFEPVAYALVADVVHGEQRIAAFGVQRMGTNLGWAIGPALGGVLTLAVPYGVVFYLAAAAMVVAGFVTLRIADPVARAAVQTKPPRGELRIAFREAWGQRAMRLLLLGTVFAALMHTQMFSTLGIHLTDKLGLAKSDVGLVYALNGLGVLALQVPALALIGRFGVARTLPWSSLANTIGFGMIGFATGFTGVALATLLITAAEVVFNPAHQAAIADAADPARRGRAYGIVSFVQMLGIACAPLFGGLLLDTIGDHHVAVWSIIATLGLCQTLCFLAFIEARTESRVPA